MSTSMEQAPPAPPKTPQLYLTPQIAKRRDGLCPSLLDLSDPSRTIKPTGGLNKPYRTNSRLLQQIKERENVSREAVEMQTIAEAVNSTLKKVVGPDEDLVSLSFKAQGCTWKMEFSSRLNDADQNYRLEVTLLANEMSGAVNYVADVMLVPKVPVDPNPLTPPLKGFREAKEVFDVVALKVRKSIVRLEFPEFPEGCKGRPFRDVYQLNARVSRIMTWKTETNDACANSCSYSC